MIMILLKHSYLVPIAFTQTGNDVDDIYLLWGRNMDTMAVVLLRCLCYVH